MGIFIMVRMVVLMRPMIPGMLMVKAVFFGFVSMLMTVLMGMFMLMFVAVNFITMPMSVFMSMGVGMGMLMFVLLVLLHFLSSSPQNIFFD